MFGKLFSGDWFFKDGDSVIIDYGFYNYEYSYWDSNPHNYKIKDNNIKINYLSDLTMNLPIYFKIGIGQTYKVIKDTHTNNNFTVNESDIYLGFHIDVWQNKNPFGKDNKQYILLIGDLITLIVDYKFKIYQNIDYPEDSNFNFAFKLATSWVLKNRMMIGYGFTFYQKISEDMKFNIHLGYIF